MGWSHVVRRRGYQERAKNHRSQFGNGANLPDTKVANTRREPSLQLRTRTFVNAPYRTTG
jgi:hypothetical protein